MEVEVFEAGERPGGISRTEKYKGFGIDIGGHRFFTKVPEVNAMWKEVLGDDLIRVPRMSRIYYRGKYYHYPLRIYNALSKSWIDLLVPYCGDYLEKNAWSERELDFYGHFAEKRRQQEELERKNIEALIEHQAGASGE